VPGGMRTDEGLGFEKCKVTLSAGSHIRSLQIRATLVQSAAKPGDVAFDTSPGGLKALKASKVSVWPVQTFQVKWMPDLVLMDVRMPQVTGLEATSQLASELPDVVVILCQPSRMRGSCRPVKKAARSRL
jgi:CheY-like chemotaxis protein